ncbi:hypothetical protein [Aquimarina sp. 2201CG5-10]|uniref:hypothetical protein n=1 Tax=Aquimarina callyspongiae TaxID=3098150 RepID=UPI002AB5D32B|nr:hypothetical protein [Aquimarina sp. 2201CG5-10]MDY8134147.1 hypothetical protein [Aquimarina sp. 2201CG5-10]
MKLQILKKYLYCFVLCLTTIAYSQNTLKLKKGTVIDSLTVPSTTNNYSVYVPKSFDVNKKWPVLLGFDSTGKADRIAKLYMSAAEEYGYIIAITNFSKEQNAKQKAEYVPVFMNHIFSLFPIQTGRVYVTGIKDDARLAGLLPALYPKDVFGVIVMGDGYYYTPGVRLEKNFTHIGIVNTKNFRYQNFLNNKNYLKRKTIPANVFAFEGNSEVPKTEVLKKALAIFNLQAILKGRIPKDSVWIKNQYKVDLKQVDTYIQQREYISAFEELNRIRSIYHHFFDTDSLKERQKEIRKSNQYRRQKKLQSKYYYQENVLRENYALSIDEDVEDKNYDNLGWWQYQVSQLDTLFNNKEKYASLMAYRTKGYLKYLVESHTAEFSEKAGDIDKRMFLHILSTIIDKKDFESYRMIISLSAQDQDYETAIFYLEKLLKNGYKDYEALYTIEGTLSLKLSKDFNRIIKKHLGKAKYLFQK